MAAGMSLLVELLELDAGWLGRQPSGLQGAELPPLLRAELLDPGAPHAAQGVEVGAKAVGLGRLSCANVVLAPRRHPLVSSLGALLGCRGQPHACGARPP
eukprot:2411113-Pyramimonas_sp.AAC.1